MTVVIVNWNTGDVLERTLPRVLASTPTSADILVVDNGSKDDSQRVVRRFMRQHPNLLLMHLPGNVGHGVALDLAATRVKTRIMVALDSDAFPLRPNWLEPAVDPVWRGDAVLAGLRSSRNFVHPVYLAVDVGTFLGQPLSFQPHWTAECDLGRRNWGLDSFDTGELLSRSIPDQGKVLLDGISCADRGHPGMTVAGVVYHHGGVSRKGSSERTSALRALDRALADTGLSLPI